MLVEHAQTSVVCKGLLHCLRFVRRGCNSWCHTSLLVSLVDFLGRAFSSYFVIKEPGWTTDSSIGHHGMTSSFATPENFLFVCVNDEIFIHRAYKMKNAPYNVIDKIRNNSNCCYPSCCRRHHFGWLFLLFRHFVVIIWILSGCVFATMSKRHGLLISWELMTSSMFVWVPSEFLFQEFGHVTIITMSVSYFFINRLR